MSFFMSTERCCIQFLYTLYRRGEVVNYNQSCKDSVYTLKCKVKGILFRPKSGSNYGGVDKGPELVP